jgi:O-antigen ligase
MPATTEAFSRAASARITADTLFAGFGAFALLLLFVGVLKSFPLLRNSPIDITPVLFGLVALHLAWALVSRRYTLPVAVPLLFTLHAVFALYCVVSAGVSQGREIIDSKLRDVVLVAPAMLLIGAAVAADRNAFRRFALASKVLAPVVGGLIAAAFAFGLVNVIVQFGGRGNLQTARVQYQLANLLLALGASAYAMAAVQARGWRQLATMGTVLVLAYAALIPGGRSGLIGLCAAVVAGPCLLLWHQARRRAAFLLAGGMALGVLALALLLFAQSQLASGLRTVERFTQGGIGESSARLPLWRAAFALIEGNGFFGLGFGGYTPAAGWGVNRDLFPHNLFIEALVELGPPGLLLFVAILLTAAFGWARAMRTAPGPQWATSACLGLIMLVLISVSTDLGNPLLWFTLGLLGATGAESSPRWT